MIALYQAAVARQPDNLAVALALGRVYFDLSMLDEAVEQLEKVEVRAPDLPVIHAFLGAVFERRGQAREALDEYRRALRSLSSFDWPHRCAACGAEHAGGRTASSFVTGTPSGPSAAAPAHPPLAGGSPPPWTSFFLRSAPCARRGWARDAGSALRRLWERLERIVSPCSGSAAAVRCLRLGRGLLARDGAGRFALRAVRGARRPGLRARGRPLRRLRARRVHAFKFGGAARSLDPSRTCSPGWPPPCRWRRWSGNGALHPRRERGRASISPGCSRGALPPRGGSPRARTCSHAGWPPLPRPISARRRAE